MNYSRNSLHINFLNLLHYYDKRDTIIFDTGVDAPVNFTLNKLPSYTCGIWLNWNDKDLDYRLPKFVGCGYVIDGNTLKGMHHSDDTVIIFGDGRLDVTMEEALNPEYKEDDFLLLNSSFKYKGVIYQGMYVYRHLNELDIVFEQPYEMVNYINTLPARVKMIKYYNIPPIQ